MALEIEGVIGGQRMSKRLTTIPGVGLLTATAIVASIGDGSQFTSARQLSALLGLVPRQYSSGGKTRLLGIPNVVIGIFERS